MNFCTKLECLIERAGKACQNNDTQHNDTKHNDTLAYYENSWITEKGL